VAIEVGAELAVPVYLQRLPRSTMQQWAEHMSREHSDSAYLKLGELGTPKEQITHVVDTTEFWQQRWTAIRATGPRRRRSRTYRTTWRGPSWAGSIWPWCRGADRRPRRVGEDAPGQTCCRLAVPYAKAASTAAVRLCTCSRP
jgi:hypothetical protein